MSTVTQLIDRCKVEIITNSKNSAGQYSVETSLLLSDIEAYLAKQQVKQEPVAYRLKNLDFDGNFDGLHCYYDLVELKKIPQELEALYTMKVTDD